jgi:PE-PPE domain/PE family
MMKLVAQPQLLATAAADLEAIRETIGAASAAAVGPTTDLFPAAADEISTAAANLFGRFADEYQVLVRHAASLQQRFAEALASAGSTYSAAEAANASAMAGASPTVVQPTLQGTPIGLIVGGSGFPIPDKAYILSVYDWSNYPIHQLDLANTRSVFTPEGLYPLTGVKDLTLDVSVPRGLSILDTTIKQTLANNPGGSVLVNGLSQSSIISSLEMENLAHDPNAPSSTQLGFTLLGDQMNPNGGFLARFPGYPSGEPLRLPSLGVTFYGATPSDTIYPTNIFSQEYDGWADFPQYPINFISDLNAFAGIFYVHGYYPFDPNALPPGYAIQHLATSPGYTGATNYYMVTNPNLPLLDPVRAIPVIGNPIADLLQPDLTTIVNLGYGDPNFGYSTGPADVQTYFGLFPHVSQALIAQDLVTGAHQGVHAFVTDIRAESSTVSLASVTSPLADLTQQSGANVLSATLTSAFSSPDNFIEALQAANTNVTNAISSTAATAYSVLLPTADVVNAVVTVLPSYDVNLFLNGIQQAINGDILGGLQYAFIAPLAADTGLLTLAGGIELEVLFDAI